MREQPVDKRRPMGYDEEALPQYMQNTNGAQQKVQPRPQAEPMSEQGRPQPKPQQAMTPQQAQPRPQAAPAPAQGRVQPMPQQAMAPQGQPRPQMGQMPGMEPKYSEDLDEDFSFEFLNL